MDNDSFRSLLDRPNTKKLDAVRSLVNADLQRAKALKKKRKAFLSADVEKEEEEEEEQNVSTKYRDRASERRRLDGDQSEEARLAAVEEMSNLVKRERKEERVVKKRAVVARDSAAACSVRRHLAGSVHKVDRISFAYDLSGPPLDATKSTLPATTSSTGSGRILLANLPPNLENALSQKPVDRDDIFAGAGKYFASTDANRRASVRRREDDDDLADDSSSKYFNAISRKKKAADLVVIDAASVELSSKNKLIHRDPIAAPDKKRKVTKKFSRNFDGTDADYGAAITYDSDDETYAAAKQRAATENR